MDKSDDAFRTIGEMASELDVKPHVLRYWEEHFPMLEPLKRAGGRRHYRSEDVALLHDIHHLLYDEGYTVKGACKALADRANGDAESPVAASAAPARDGAGANGTGAVEEIHAQLKAIRDRLVAALASS